MAGLERYHSKNPIIIAALHLPPFQASAHPAAKPVSEIVEFALRNVAMAASHGVQGLYLQDLGDYPWAPKVQPHILAGMGVVGAAVRREFPDLFLGVSLMSNGAREPLAIAQAIGAQFVRLKTYTGAMVKAEGIVQGCAFEAITYRAQIQAEEIAILADVYDRSGEPLGRLPLAEAATQAAVFGRADGLILTGHTFSESLKMLAEVRAANLGVLQILGGGANPQNLTKALAHADGIIISSSFKSGTGWSHASLASDWEEDRIEDFMQAVRAAIAGE